MQIPARLCRALVLASLALLGACNTWSRRPMPAPGRDDFFMTARITPVEGLPIFLDNVTVGRDSVVGRERVEPHARVAIPVSEVRMVETRRTDPLATAAVVVLSVTASTAAFGALMLSIVGTGS